MHEVARLAILERIQRDEYYDRVRAETDRVMQRHGELLERLRDA